METAWGWRMCFDGNNEKKIGMSKTDLRVGEN
jgi:hypothetical protein